VASNNSEETMKAIHRVLVNDSDGRPTERYRLVASRDWDEIRAWSDKVYMPYRVMATGRANTPNSVLDAVKIGRLTMSRFKYGIPIHVEDFSPNAGTGLVLTSIGGSARHWSEGNAFHDTGVGDAFLVDNSRTHYWVDFDKNHLQLNLTFEHDAMASLHERWFGAPADERMWTLKFRFGGVGSSWLSLLEYACQCVIEMPDAVQQGPLGRHLEEALGIHLLTQWRAQLAQPRPANQHRIAPRHVLAAERHIREHAQCAPTLSELAAEACVSVRTLSKSFQEYRGCTPMDALKEHRLQRVRAELLAAGPGETVSSVARRWGYANLGLFAGNYKKRFGEGPSQSLR
jgi:AraC-like DNA-binding protein